MILLAAVLGSAYAQADVYVCVGENGSKEYKNTGNTKGCKRVDLPSITMIPAPAKKPAIQTASARSSSSSSSSPGGFPRIDSDTQKTRDSDRKQILMDEMSAEEQKFAELKKEFNNGEPERRGDERNYAKYQERTAAMKENLERTEKNIAALKREIGNLK